MSEHKTLAAALAAFQAKMPTVPKAKRANTGSYGYSYADLADVSQAVMPLLAAEGLAFTTHPRRTVEGSYELAATLLHAASEEKVEGALPIHGASPQQIGSAITYARRYLLGCLTGVVTDDDEDGALASRPAPQARQARSATRQAPQQAPQQDPGEAVTGKTRGRLFALMGEVVGDDPDTQRRFLTDTVGRSVESRADLTQREAQLAIMRLEAWERGEAGAAWSA